MLGGQGSLKRKRSQHYSHDVVPEAEAQSNIQVPAPVAIEHSSAVKNVTSAPGTNKPAVAPSKPFWPKDDERKARPPHRQHFWFLPDDAQSCVSASDTRSNSVASESRDNKPEQVFGMHTANTVVADLIAPTPQDAPPDTSNSPNVKEESQEPVRKKARTTKVSRELRRLQIDANPSLLASSPQEDAPTAQPSKQTSSPAPARPRRTLQLDEPSPSQQLPPKHKKVKRELHKLRIDANPALGGKDLDIAAPARTAGPGRRSGRNSRYLERETQSILSENRSRKKQWKPTVLEIHKFPKDPPSQLADHILLLLADAAQESNVVRALNGDARQAIRDMRYQSQFVRDRRMQQELAIIEDWPVASEPEALRLRALIGSPSNGPSPPKSPAGAQSLPDQPAADSTSSDPDPVSSADIIPSAVSSRTSQSSSANYWTPLNLGTPAQNTSTEKENGIEPASEPAEPVTPTPMVKSAAQLDVSPVRNGVVKSSSPPSQLPGLENPTGSSHQEEGAVITAGKEAGTGPSVEKPLDESHAAESCTMIPAIAAAGQSNTDHNEHPMIATKDASPTPRIAKDMAADNLDLSTMTRILEPDNDGTVPDGRWKGKHRISIEDLV